MNRNWLRDHWLDVATVIGGVAVALLLRLSLLDFKSVDYFNYTKGWYAALKGEGFAAFGREFSNYNIPYLYLLYAVIRTLPDVAPHVAVKIPSLIADFVASFLVFRITRIKYASAYMPFLAAFCLLIAPTVVLNSAFWGQADAIYACALLACILFLARGNDGPAMAFFGLALSFKVQSLFLAPLVAGLILRGHIRWRSLVWIPLVFLGLLVPAWLMGRSPVDLLLIYPSQAGQYQQLTLHAPSALAWIPDTGRFFRYFSAAGVIIGASAAMGLAWAIARSRAKLAPALLIELALVSAILIPFCLPRMHERYFFLADVLSIVAAFLQPSLFFAPIGIITASFFAYQPTLFGAEPVSSGLLALGILLVLLGVLRDAIPRLFPPTDPTTARRPK